MTSQIAKERASERKEKTSKKKQKKNYLAFGGKKRRKHFLFLSLFFSLSAPTKLLR